VTAKVFMAQANNRIDTRDAERFGEIVTVVDRLGEPSVAPRSMLYDVRKGLANYEHGDYILPTGSPVVIAAVVMLASRKSDGVINMLRWDRKNKRYESSTLDIRTLT